MSILQPHHRIIGINGQSTVYREPLCIVGWRLEGEIAARNVDGILLKLINNKVI